MAKANLSWVCVSSLIVFSFLLTASPGFASTTSAGNIYISQSGTGSGTSCADALPVSWFNNAANWGNGPTQIGPGTTVHLCGTITAAAGASGFLTAQGSGTSGNPITVKFEPNAVVQSPNFGVNGAIDLSGRSWITVDGGGTGTIQNTLTGTSGGACPGGPCAFSTGHPLIEMSSGGGASNILITNLNCWDIYMHLSTSDTSGGGECVSFINNNNITIDHVICHDGPECANGWGNNIVIAFNEFYNCNRCITFGSNSPTSSLIVHDNYIHDHDNWNTTGDVFHHDGIHMFPGSAGNMSGVQIYNNVWANLGTCCTTAQIYFEGNFTNPIVYNNLCTDSESVRLCMWFDTDIGGATSGAQVYNNTMSNGGFTCTGGCTNMTFKNNIFIKQGTCSGSLWNMNSGASVTAMDSNVYETITSSCQISYSGTSYSSLAAWQSAAGFDTNSVNGSLSQINLSADWHLQAGSIATSAGANLTSLGITALNSDKAGLARPASGPWDIGAYASGSTVARPAAPTGLTATVQ